MITSTAKSAPAIGAADAAGDRDTDEEELALLGARAPPARERRGSWRDGVDFRHGAHASSRS
jgi:hypothetical protein